MGNLFQPGHDPRRDAALRSRRNGRPLGAEAISRLVRTTLGRDAKEIVERTRELALAGDPQAVTACATLLPAVIAQPAKVPGKQDKPA